MAMSTRQVYGSVNILVNRYDPSGTAANLAETVLKTSNVNKQQFGHLFGLPVYGQIFAQPLYVSNVRLPGGDVHNILYVATMENAIYVFDADSAPLLWTHNLSSAGGPRAGPFPIRDFVKAIFDKQIP